MNSCYHNKLIYIKITFLSSPTLKKQLMKNLKETTNEKFINANKNTSL